jgi:hypothetical protein
MQAIVTAYTESYVDTRPYYRSTFIAARTYSRAATGTGTGSDLSVISGSTQLRLGGLTDYSFPYLGGGRFYLSAPISQKSATGSGSSSSVSSGFATKAKLGTGSGAGSAVAVGVRIVGRTATGSAVGVHVAVISGPTQLRLGAITDFSFPYLTGGRFYLGPAYYLRTASGDGTGSQSTVSIHVVVRSASGSGSAGESTSTDLEILFRSATGSGTSSGEADPFLFVIRAASGSGSGNSSSVFIRKLLRSSSGSGAGTSSATRLVKNRRSATGSGIGSAVAIRLVSTIRTATAFGTGTASSISIELLPRTATGSGVGATSGQVIWIKSRIFRVPNTTGFAWAELFGDRLSSRVFSRLPQGVRQENLWRLPDGTYTINDPGYGVATREYLGGHNIFLTDEEVSELTAAGYGAYIT